MVVFQILRAVRRAHSKLTGFQESRIWGFLFGSVPWDGVLEGAGAQENWLIFKNHLL